MHIQTNKKKKKKDIEQGDGPQNDSIYYGVIIENTSIDCHS